MTVLATLAASLSSSFTVVREISAALLTALMAGLCRSLRIVREVPTALLTALVTRLGCTLAILSEVSGAATMLALAARRHVISPYPTDTNEQLLAIVMVSQLQSFIY